MLPTNKIILGTVQFGLNYGINNTIGKPNANDVFEMLTYASENGITILDTANAYGEAQKIISHYLKSNTNKFEINTKFHCEEGSIKLQLEESQNELGIEKINTYFYHNFNDLKNFPDSINQLKVLKTQNCINQIGVSIYDNEQFLQAIINPFIDVIQLPYNLLDNYNKRGKLIEKAKLNNKVIQTRSVFLQGLFFKNLHQIPDKLMPLKKYLSKINILAEQYHVAIKDLALSYAVSSKGVDQVIIGVDSLNQLKENIQVSLLELPCSLKDEIDQINVEEVNLLYPYNW